MDKIRRGKLHNAVKMLTDAYTVVELVCDKEDDCVNNYPENLQGTEKFERMEDAVDRLNDAMEKIDEARNYIHAAIGA